MKYRIFETGGEMPDNGAATFNSYVDTLIANQQADNSAYAEPTNASVPAEEENDYIKGLRNMVEEEDKVDPNTYLDGKLSEMESRLNDRMMSLTFDAMATNPFDDEDEEVDAVNSRYNTNDPTIPYAPTNQNSWRMDVFGKEAFLKGEDGAYKFFIRKGYAPHIAAGMVANIKHESNFNVNASGDNGKAKGYAQWHPDRYNELSKLFDLNTAQGNLEAIDYELKNKETGAYKKLLTATTPEQAAMLFDKNYERSAGLTTPQRMKYARQIFDK